MKGRKYIIQVAGYKWIASMTAEHGRRTAENCFIPGSEVCRLFENSTVGRNLSYILLQARGLTSPWMSGASMPTVDNPDGGPFRYVFVMERR